MASDLDTLRASIEAAVAALSLGGIPISWPGVDFSPPEGTWLKADIVWGGGAMTTGGSGVTGNHVTGILKLRLSTTPGAGLGALYDLADTCRTAFSRANVGTAFFFAPSPPRDASENAWAAVVIDCPFRAREA